MNRAFLRWFYVSVQFVMLAVSIPKVATLFHAYDQDTFGLVWAGIDARSWLVGLAIDLTATLTTWAAMAKFDESRKRASLFAPAVIILFCAGLSIVANYEDAATLHPEQYADVSLFTHPALLVNPILISAPPILVLLLILLVPSVLAQPRIKSAAEIAAQADEQEALIVANARVREAKVKANARVRDVRLKGFVESVSAMASRTEEPSVAEVPVLSEDADTAPAKMTRAMWQAMKLPERVLQSGVITPQEVAEILGISLSHARNLVKEVPDKSKAIPGRTGVSYMALIDALYDRRTRDSYAWARKLETTLGVRKRRQLQVVPDEEIIVESTIEPVEELAD